MKGLVDLSNKYQKVIELIYYPPYHSKYNPVERLWARLEKTWNGMMLTTEEIYDIIEAYGDAALTAMKAGMDAVELHCAHGYLVSTFISPRT